MTSRPSRRQVLAAAAAAPAAVTLAAVAQPSTQPASGQAFEEVDIDAAGRLFGRQYADTERQLMRSGLAQSRQFLDRLRQREIPPGVEPALGFDPILHGMHLPTGEARFEPPRVQPPAYNGDPESLAFATVPELAALMEAGQVTSLELTRMYLDRLKRHDPALLCVITLTEDLAIEQARRADAERKAGRVRGPLHGIPYGAKDLLATKGIPTTYGVAPYRDQVFDFDATVIQRLEAAGAVLLGKTSLGELAMGDVWFGGTTKNPWDPEKGSSGSSAGSASGTAAGLLPFGIGSETLGSIVSPCVVCGTCGLRPTFGRVPRTGALPLTRSMDKLGVLARGVDDLAYVLQAIAGADAGDPTSRDVPFSWTGRDTSGLRVGYDKLAFDALEQMPEGPRRDLYSAALETCRELFGELTPIELPRDRMAQPVVMSTIEVEGAESFSELIDAGGLQELVQQEAWNWPNTFRRAALFPAVDYLRAQRVRRQLMEQVQEAVGEVDAYVTIPRVGPSLVLMNLAGYPCVIQRAGVIEGMPHQIEFVGRPYREGALLAVASRFEQTVAERDQWPRDRWA